MHLGVEDILFVPLLSSPFLSYPIIFLILWSFIKLLLKVLQSQHHEAKDVIEQVILADQKEAIPRFGGGEGEEGEGGEGEGEEGERKRTHI